jgi:hypothetical protein
MYIEKSTFTTTLVTTNIKNGLDFGLVLSIIKDVQQFKGLWMNPFLDLILKIASSNDITDADRAVALRVISTIIIGEGQATARLQRINASLLAQLSDNDAQPLIPAYEPTSEEVERLQVSFVSIGYDLHHYGSDHKFPKGVFYAEKLSR